MKLIINKNLVSEVEKEPKDLKDKCVKYEGYTIEGEDITIYDVEGNKLAPIVRYLIEGDIGGRAWGKILIFGLLGLIVVGILFWLLGTGKATTGDKAPTNNIASTLTRPPVKENINNKEDTNNIQNNKKIESVESYNEIEMYKNLKSEAEMEAVRVNFELQKKDMLLSKKNIQIEDLKEENQKLKEENQKLKEKLKIEESKFRNTPGEAFIYFLGKNIYERCEKSNTEEKKTACKELYYKFLKNDTLSGKN